VGPRRPEDRLHGPQGPGDRGLLPPHGGGGAEHHLTVDFHGAYASSGEERTFPHWLTARHHGLEYVKWSDRVTPRHDVTIPFTRMLVGPMDYTPGGFRNVTREAFEVHNELPLVMTTRATSSRCTWSTTATADALGHARRLPRRAGAEFLKMVPTTWDETRVVEGKIASTS